MAKVQHIEIIRGDTNIIRVTMDENGSVSGWNFGFGIRNRRSEPDSVSSVVTHNTAGVTIAVFDEGSDNTPAVIDITVEKAVTISLEERPYWWSLKRTDTGFDTTIVHGFWYSVNTAYRS